MSVTVRLYAGVREAAGRDELELDATSIGEVRTALAATFPAAAGRLATCRFAVDHEFVSEDAALPDGAVVDVIPPVSGG